MCVYESCVCLALFSIVFVACPNFRWFFFPTFVFVVERVSRNRIVNSQRYWMRILLWFGTFNSGSLNSTQHSMYIYVLYVVLYTVLCMQLFDRSPQRTWIILFKLHRQPFFLFVAIICFENDRKILFDASTPITCVASLNDGILCLLNVQLSCRLQCASPCQVKSSEQAALSAENYAVHCLLSLTHLLCLFAQLLNASINQSKRERGSALRSGTTRTFRNECLHLCQHSLDSWFTIHLCLNWTMMHLYVLNFVWFDVASNRFGWFVVHWRA